MGIRFHKSKLFFKGLIRLNFSKSGIGISVGNKIFRLGISPKGIVKKTIPIPKTGISFVSSKSIKNNKK